MLWAIYRFKLYQIMINHVLFINPLVSLDDGRLFELEFPSHVIYLASFLEDRISNVNIKCLDFIIEEKINKTIDLRTIEGLTSFLKEFIDSSFKFIANDELFIAISCFSSFHYLNTLKVIKALHLLTASSSIPIPRIIVGGYHASALPSDFDDYGVDYIIRGEGEVALYSILKHGRKNSDKISKSNQILWGDIIEDLNTMPLMNFLHYERYLPYYPHLSIALSRGCPSSCNFCIESLLSRKKTKTLQWRSYSKDRARVEINNVMKISDEYLRTNKEKVLGFYDPTFGFNIKWRDSILDYLFELKSGYEIWLETRVETINKKRLSKFKDANAHFMLGMESASPRMLSIMKKTKNPSYFLDKIEEIVRISNKLDYGPFILNLLLNFPGETKNTIEETFSFLNKLIIDGCRFNTTCMFYTLFPGDGIYRSMGRWEEKHGTKFYYKDWWKDEATMISGSIIDPSYSLNFDESAFIYGEKISNFYKNCMTTFSELKYKIYFIKRIKSITETLRKQQYIYRKVPGNESMLKARSSM